MTQICCCLSADGGISRDVENPFVTARPAQPFSLAHPTQLVYPACPFQPLSPARTIRGFLSSSLPLVSPDAFTSAWFALMFTCPAHMAYHQPGLASGGHSSWSQYPPALPVTICFPAGYCHDRHWSPSAGFPSACSCSCHCSISCPAHCSHPTLQFPAHGIIQLGRTPPLLHVLLLSVSQTSMPGLPGAWF